jgi:hypothetical protein
LGLSDQVIFPRPYTVLLHNGKWYPFDSILKALLRLPSINLTVPKLICPNLDCLTRVSWDVMMQIEHRIRGFGINFRNFNRR